MNHLAEKLRRQIATADVPKRSLGREDQRLLRFIRTESERATKGRLISRHLVEQDSVAGGGKWRARFMVVLEGRHSMSVGTQIARRFSDFRGVDNAEVERTDRGASVLIVSAQANEV